MVRIYLLLVALYTHHAYAEAASNNLLALKAHIALTQGDTRTAMQNMRYLQLRMQQALAPEENFLKVLEQKHLSLKETFLHFSQPEETLLHEAHTLLQSGKQREAAAHLLILWDMASHKGTLLSEHTKTLADKSTHLEALFLQCLDLENAALAMAKQITSGKPAWSYKKYARELLPMFKDARDLGDAAFVCLRPLAPYAKFLGLPCLILLAQHPKESKQEALNFICLWVDKESAQAIREAFTQLQKTSQTDQEQQKAEQFATAVVPRNAQNTKELDELLAEASFI